MSRKKAISFWKTPLSSDLYSMLLNRSAPLLDEMERPEIFSYLPPIQGRTVLDLGSGIGRFTQEFAKRGAKKIVSVDISAPFLEENRRINQKFPMIEYLQEDAFTLKIKEKFDIVFISWLFQYGNDREVKSLVSKITSWLNIGGHLFFRESCSPSLKKTKKSYFAIYRRFIDYPKFFSPISWSLVKEGTIKAYEEIDADPMKGFWLYQKRP